MALTLLLGGARAGKSDLAVRIAQSWQTPVTFVATAEAWDDEMAARIRRHQANRPAEWTTVEEPRHLDRVLAGVPADSGVVIDCLTLWVNNVMVDNVPDDEVPDLARRLAEQAAVHPGGVVAVTNEVGLGVVPVNRLSRRYVDLLGAVNRAWVQAADRSLLVVAGRVVALPPTELDAPPWT
jgi:adenosylcobinamide kinase / adenosylcobinamide-phosphate guanylyltransferase